LFTTLLYIGEHDKITSTCHALLHAAASTLHFCLCLLLLTGPIYMIQCHCRHGRFSYLCSCGVSRGRTARKIVRERERVRESTRESEREREREEREKEREIVAFFAPQLLLKYV
jgi:hypothetical protein